MSHYKVQTYLPATHCALMKEELNKVLTPIFKNYDFVFTETQVTGFWRPLAGAKPFLGQINTIASAPEIKLEFTILPGDVNKAFATIRQFHPYEHPVIEAVSVIVP